MGKKLKIVFILIFAFVLSLNCFAAVNESDIDDLLDAVPDGTVEIDSGNIDYNSLSDKISFNGIFKQVLDVISDELKNCSRIFFSLLIIVLLFSLLSTFGLDEKSELKSIAASVAGVVVFAVAFSTIMSNIELISDAAKSAKVFSTASVPVITALSVSSGESFGGVIFSAAVSLSCSIFQYAADSLLLPVSVVFLMFGLVSSFTADLNIISICLLIKKFVKWVIGIFIGIFTASLSFQNILSASADGAVKRGIQSAVSKFVPNVGSVLSGSIDGLFALASGSKTTVAVFGMLVITMLFLPLITGNLLYGGSVSICKYISSFFKSDKLSSVLSVISDVFFLLAGICSACAFMLIASFLFLCMGVR